MKRTVRVIEVSIYKWTRCPIFYITQSRKENLPEKKQREEEKISYITCVYVSYDGKRKSITKKKTGKKIKWRRSLAIKKSFDAIYGYPVSWFSAWK